MKFSFFYSHTYSPKLYHSVSFFCTYVRKSKIYPFITIFILCSYQRSCVLFGIMQTSTYVCILLIWRENVFWFDLFLKWFQFNRDETVFENSTLLIHYSNIEYIPSDNWEFYHNEDWWQLSHWKSYNINAASNFYKKKEIFFTEFNINHYRIKV